MFTVRVREHIMIAHSFQGEVFGPAQRLHGATFVVDLELFRPGLDEHGIVCDIGLLHEILKKVLGPLNYHNLDEDPSLAGRNTTTEVLAETIHARVSALIREGALGAGMARSLSNVRVTLHESHVASASYEAPPA